MNMLKQLNAAIEYIETNLCAEFDLDTAAGFAIERLVEETDEKSLSATGEVDPKTKKAKMCPISFCIKARKL